MKIENIDSYFDTFLTKSIPIKEQVWDDGISPMVSICCITYNHEAFIRDAIEGFLLQRTSFSFEIIIHDDASTDGTIDIIKEYENKFPDFIIPIYQKENQYSKGIKPTINFVFPKARGKYIALCEGDDYWTDPVKLQRQVEFLEQYSEFGAIAENAIILYDNGERQLFGKRKSRILELADILRYRQFATASVLFRNNINIPESFNEFLFGDTPLMLIIHKHAPIYYRNIVSSVYRRGQHGITSKLITNEYKQEILKYNILLDNLTDNKYPGIISKRILSLNLFHEKYFYKKLFFINRLLFIMDNAFYHLFLFVARPKQKHYMDLGLLLSFKKIYHMIFR